MLIDLTISCLSCSAPTQCRVWRDHFNLQEQTRIWCQNQNLMCRLIWLCSASRLICNCNLLSHEFVDLSKMTSLVGLVYASERQSFIQDAVATVYRSTGQWYVILKKIPSSAFWFQNVICIVYASKLDVSCYISV